MVLFGQLALADSIRPLQSLHDLSHLQDLSTLFPWPGRVLRFFSVHQNPPTDSSSDMPPASLSRIESSCPALDSQPHGSRILLCDTGLFKSRSAAPAHFPFLEEQGLCVICLCIHPTRLPPRTRKYIWHMVNAGRF